MRTTMRDRSAADAVPNQFAIAPRAASLSSRGDRVLEVEHDRVGAACQRFRERSGRVPGTKR